jgi:ABC-2 type transport system ATP-binding protein
MENMLADGRTLLLVSHNERDLRRLCTRGIYLRDGRTFADGPIEDMIELYNADSEREQ